MNQLQNLSEDEKNIIVEVIEALGIVKSGSKHSKHLDGNNINLSIAVIMYVLEHVATHMDKNPFTGKLVLYW